MSTTVQIVTVIAAAVGVFGLLAAALQQVFSVSNKRTDDLRAEMVRGFNGLRAEMASEFRHINERFDRVNDQFGRVDDQFARVDDQFARVDERFDRMDQRFDRMDARLDRIDSRLDGQDSRLTDLQVVTARTDERLRATEQRQVS